jgi:V8-like Glu-specific endopeptidase
MNISIISKEVARWAELFLFLAVATASSLSSVLADEAEVAYLQSTRRQSSDSYASNNRALMRDGDDEQPSEEEPDVASIINGTATGGPLSYQVGLAREVGGGSLPNCGGSLIASRVVLTAAHCTGLPIDPPLNKVLINAYNLASGSGGIRVRVRVHQGYNPTTFENDSIMVSTISYWRR